MYSRFVFFLAGFYLQQKLNEPPPLSYKPTPYFFLSIRKGEKQIIDLGNDTTHYGTEVDKIRNYQFLKK